MKIPETGVLLIHSLLTLRERYQLDGGFLALVINVLMMSEKDTVRSSDFCF